MKTIPSIAVLAIAVLGFLLFAPAQVSPTQDKPAKPQTATSKADSGISRQQADEILEELKAIHKLLEKLQAAQVSAPPQPVPDDKVKLKLEGNYPALGREDAPITVVEFTDYQCPFCKKFETDAFAEFKKNYIDTGKVRFVSRDLPLDFHANANRAAEAARCAGDQGKFWELRSAMISNANDLSQDAILRYAQGLSIDVGSLKTCIETEKHKQAIQSDIAAANGIGIIGTPSFVFAKTRKDGELDGLRVVGALPFSSFESVINKLLAQN